jgi:uncharacterized membrane protein AbrB (regulator of aidB expression)
LSEVLNAKVISNENSGVSRRRVVAGVAWSLPVIATAIAAPAAAASGIPASVTMGAIGTSTAVGSAGSLAVQAPTTFDVQTGTAFTGSSVSYTITIQSVASDQNSRVEITATSPAGTGSSTSGKVTTFTGVLSTSPGNHTLQVALAGFKYTNPNKAGTYTYTVTLTVSVSATPVVSTLTITFP